MLSPTASLLEPMLYAGLMAHSLSKCWMAQWYVHLVLGGYPLSTEAGWCHLGGKGNQNNSVTSHIREHHLCVYLCALLPSVKTGGVESCSTWQISSSQSRNALGPRWQGRGTSKSLADVAAAQNRRQGSQQSWEILDITWIHFVKFKVLESAWKQMRSLKMLEKSPNFNLLIVVFWLSCASIYGWAECLASSAWGILEY